MNRARTFLVVLAVMAAASCAVHDIPTSEVATLARPILARHDAFVGSLPEPERTQPLAQSAAALAALDAAGETLDARTFAPVMLPVLYRFETLETDRTYLLGSRELRGLLIEASTP